MRSKAAKLTLGIAAAVFLFGVIGIFALIRLKDSFLYPSPPPMPVGVADSVQVLTGRLEAMLRTNAPQILAGLNPGLSEEKIKELEGLAGLTLPEDLKQLYRWRNGQSSNELSSFLPGHRFVSLEEAVSKRGAQMNGIGATSRTQKAAFTFFAGHRSPWLTVFDDGADDGYFFDPDRAKHPGHFFFNMAEGPYYMFFPSLSNFMAGLIEAHSKAAIHWNDQKQVFEEDFNATSEIWERFGSSNETK